MSPGALRCSGIRLPTGSASAPPEMSRETNRSSFNCVAFLASKFTVPHRHSSERRKSGLELLISVSPLPSGLTSHPTSPHRFSRTASPSSGESKGICPIAASNAAPSSEPSGEPKETATGLVRRPPTSNGDNTARGISKPAPNVPSFIAVRSRISPSAGGSIALPLSIARSSGNSDYRRPRCAPPQQQATPPDRYRSPFFSTEWDAALHRMRRAFAEDSIRQAAAH
jgi:hypothetical protein